MYTGNCRSGRRYDSMFLSLKYWVLVLQKWKYRYKAYFSLTWPVAMHIHLASSYAHLLQQKKCLHKKRVQLPLRLVWTTNCFLFCFGTPTGQKWNHEKVSIYWNLSFFRQLQKGILIFHWAQFFLLKRGLWRQIWTEMGWVKCSYNSTG